MVDWNQISSLLLFMEKIPGIGKSKQSISGSSDTTCSLCDDVEKMAAGEKLTGWRGRRSLSLEEPVTGSWGRSLSLEVERTRKS